MRILHVAYIYPPKLDVADGITAVVYNITKELAKRGHEVAVYTSDMLDLHGNNALRSGHSVVNGVDVYYSKSILRSKTFVVTPSVISSLSNNLSKYDVIHIHDCRSFQGISAFLFAKMKNVPYVFQPHGSYLSSSPASPFTTLTKIGLDKLVSSKIVRNASKIIALSKMEAEQYRCAGILNEKIVVVPNGIDLVEYVNLPPRGSFRKKFNIQDGKKIILYLGRIHKTKGIDLLINAYAHMIKTTKRNNTILVIAGPDDGYLAEAKSLADSSGISDPLLFTGFIDGKDKLAALVDADLFVTPSFYGFPMTFLEACAVGVPIVTTTLGDTLEWIDGKVGYVSSSTTYGVAEAIHRIISDDKIHQEFSRNCKEIVRSNFSLEKTVNLLEQTYRDAVRLETSNLQ